MESVKEEKISLSNKIIYFIPILYLLIVCVFMLWHRAWFSPDQFFIFATLGTIILGRLKQFVFDWLPALFLFLGYECLRGVIPILSLNPHIFPLIRADFFLFGFLPTIRLQNLLFTQGINHWYDYLAGVLYISHFIVPMVVAFLFWLYDRQYFKKFMTAILVLSYLGFLTYILFPAMPPWMASNQGYLPPLKKIIDQVFVSFGPPVSLPTVYKFFGADEVAAFPSLHAAFPWLVLLFVTKKIGKRGLLLFPYVFGVWFAVVYLGEHYVVDVLAGIIYASAVFSAISYLDGRKLILQTKGGE